MADSIHCKRIYLDAIERTSFSSSSSSADHVDQFPIYLKFSVKSRFSNYIIHQDSTQPTYYREEASVLTYILVNLDQSSAHEKARETLDRELESWPIWASGRRDLIQAALNKAQETVGSMPPQHDSVYLHFRVNAIHVHVFYENRAIDRSINEDDKGFMVPASESSIESLEKKTWSMDISGTTCSVCLEDVVRGCRGLLCMPCLHVFHGDCIKKWLRTSHYCPVCRFEMPTS